MEAYLNVSGYKVFENKHRKYSIHRPQYKLGIELLRDASGVRALDLGCGLGEFTDILRDRGYDTYAVEGLEEFVSSVRERYDKVWQANLEFEDLPFEDDSFDIVVSLDVIEHLWNTVHYLDEIKRIVKPGGAVILTTTNYNYWRFRLTHLRGRFHEFTFGSRHKKFYDDVSFPQEVSKAFTISRYLGLRGTLFGKKQALSTNSRSMSILALTLGVLAVNKK